MSRIRGLNLPLLGRIQEGVATELLMKSTHAIEVHYVDRKEITRLNEQFLGHEGSTDVITFDYGGDDVRQAEIFVCVDEAMAQAKEFSTTPQMELVRYLVHGLLHLRGYDDGMPAQRKKMKRMEDILVAWVDDNFACDKVWSRKPRA